MIIVTTDNPTEGELRDAVIKIEKMMDKPRKVLEQLNQGKDIPTLWKKAARHENRIRELEKMMPSLSPIKRKEQLEKVLEEIENEKKRKEQEGVPRKYCEHCGEWIDED